MNAQEGPVKKLSETEEKAVNKRLETIAWALFLVMIGGIGLVPKERVPEGLWLVGVGLIMLGLNLARYLNKIKMSNGTLVLGILALLSGLGDLVGVDMPVFAILLILIGLHTILKLVRSYAVEVSE